jgi:hypothetical protein
MSSTVTSPGGRRAQILPARSGRRIPLPAAFRNMVRVVRPAMRSRVITMVPWPGITS